MAENTKMEVGEDVGETIDEREGEENMDENAGEGSDSSDSEDSDSHEAVHNPQIQQLELQVEKSPYHYDSHVELIKLLRESGDLDRVRNAREGMSKIFPLTQDLWSEWLKDEIPLACIPEQREKVIALFERAVKDYQSVRVWILYCQFMMDIMEGQDSLQGVRATFEKAIIAAGLHVTEGSSIWEGYREFETDILESLEQMVTEENKETMMEKISSQKEKVMSIFKRQLGVPLLGMQATLREFEDWLEDSVPDAVMIAYEKALAKLEECLPFEDTLGSAQPPKTTEFKSYLAYELKKGDPARIQCLYERAMNKNCLVGDMWTEYTSYLDSTLKITTVVLPIHERAVRNCPWVSLLWQNYLRALERNNQDHNKVKETLDTALGCGFSASDDYLQLWHCYCDYMRRRVEDWSEDSQQVKDLRENFKTATEYLQNYFGKAGDPTNLLERYWARVEAFHINDVSECQRLWDNVILSNHGREAEFWLEYANILSSPASCPVGSDNPEMVIQALLSFEREEGTLEDWDAAFSRCRVQLLRVNERRQKVAEKEVVRARAEEETQEKRKRKNAERKATKKVEQKKAKMEMKKRKATDQGISGDKTKQSEEDSGEPAAKKPHIAKESDVPSATHATSTGEPSTTEKIEHDSTKDANTVFVSNLLFSIDEERLKETLLPHGEITEIRLVKNQMGKSKGFAYVVFKNQSSVQAALSMDRTKLDGRPMFISPSVDKSKNPTQFKFPTSLDKKTVFVSNLPFDIKESDVENVFKKHGKVTQVRLVTNRAGKPKGYGYIEYEEETSAPTAIVALDGSLLGERQISVALSNPPSRRPRQPGADQQQRPKEQPGSRGRARTQLQLLPRSLQKTASSAPAPSSQNSTPSSEGKTEAKNGAEPKQGFSNEYFKNLMQRKK
ncbi:positive regulation of histone deubiquitination [Desmophyllum pertusum]|uniref:Positive regulation of histone deubiquitination n=1 Tax=Desmophyllum pertusum TaxID=174260 RepID=A0A9W9ZTI2_9CNID|nr:positive regulation of histone deubiquitination [Desmophyllum pertusum]